MKMSLREFTSRLLNYGQHFLKCYSKRKINTNIFENDIHSGKLKCLPKNGPNNINIGLEIQKINFRSLSGLFRFGQQARKLFVQNLLNRVTPISSNLRNEATKKLFYGDSVPFFALVGVSLGSGAGILTKEDELETVCWEIRKAAHEIQNTWNTDDISIKFKDNFSLDQLEVGSPIDKGCAAVVYAAAIKENDKHETMNDMSKNYKNLNSKSKKLPKNISKILSPIQNISKFVHNFGNETEKNLHFCSSNTVNLSSNNLQNITEHVTNSLEVNFEQEAGSSTSNIKTTENDKLDSNLENTSICRYPLALKMMFNYDIQSNALAILKSMYHETIPSRQRPKNLLTKEWENLLGDQIITISPHPNIVLMYGYFCAEVGNFDSGSTLYPMAQPQRINPNGYGRNMSLYLLMKRYDFNLRNYLNIEKPNLRTRLLLFTQLLESITHLSRHGVAHRDLKSDNILIEIMDDKSPPLLVLSDFGCCLADKIHGLKIPYTNIDINKGGNVALMAPEIINKLPGTFSILDYTKSDLWACGTIAYEIFGYDNPFYSKIQDNTILNDLVLKNKNYKLSDLPEINNECPDIIKLLILNILNPNPNQRLSPEKTATIMQLYLWAPSSWLKSNERPSSPEILQWLLSLTTKVMSENRRSTINKNNYKLGRRTSTEYLIISCFLMRVRLQCIRGALSWIQKTV